ncbi:glycerophosphodiester phosphodiesterase [Chlorobium phaeovibrioides]|uniref:Glycerophosphodiester phosphodiesterase n=2 Tax=Chlorobium phaeovibrioides TaxID=1094 RepID=A0A432ASU3_CHLPH|nr:glycerophosphodiester phosphodiesterase family protein [Chlorobium phaeovibrioides]HCD36538.1 glycerophosphodiester phosphodiesterase [Chlorobium sp.]MWV53482.1 glycerophosphodiester phosphodiesterase [Chlorobium phaeovibrioides]QEQ57577.1 glycerophosphodiester phosphodiesterase [Chlorobium phaeovibrioides]RTY36212.1 glycerophosphodiester phosphodiesterase [Chlorobium phaeovibrioides]RTY36262.1 glycerophosphodiester phosphodiesterase [Chlorobium phaeovibrioides]
MTSSAERPFEVQAHRGGRLFFPENTLQAFCSAADLGFRVVELDLHVSRDRRIVVAHDPLLPSGKNLKGSGCSRQRIFSLTYSRIAGYDCGMPHPDFPLQQRIAAAPPLLSDVFACVEGHMADSGSGGEMVYNLEIKSWPQRDGIFHPPPRDYAALVLGVVRDAGMLHRVRLQSFDLRVVREVYRQAPDAACGLLAEKASSIRPALRRLGFTPRWLNPHSTLATRRLVRQLHARGMRVIPWTVNTPEEASRLRAIGADGIITDVADGGKSWGHS